MTFPLFPLTRRRTLIGIGAGLGAATATSLPTSLLAAPEPQEKAAAQELDAIAWNLLAREPMQATSLGVDTGAHAALRGELGDPSPAGQKQLAETLKSDLARVNARDLSELSPTKRTSFEVVQSAYSTALDGLALPYGDVAVGGWRNAPYVVIQNVGAYLDYPRFMDNEQPVETRADAEAYLARLGAMPAAFDGELARMKSARAMGVVPPDFLCDKAIAAMTQTLADARDGKLFVPAFAKRLADNGLPDSYAASAKSMVAGPIVAALARQLEELQAERAANHSAPGMWSQPQGDEWYRWALRASTTTRLSPQEVHKMGLEQLAEIHGRMDPILKSLGYTKGSVGARMQALAKDKRYQFPKGDAGREQILAFVSERIKWIKAQMPRAFERLVNPNFEVRRLPPAEEAGAPTAYGGAGSKDGKIPGKMWINLRTTDLHRTYTLPTLVHHETIPGHVWQGEYANELPLIRSMLAFNAYSEGWALYAELLADELGAYDDHPAWRLGYLQDQAFRACRLVVDSGLHAMRWTRQKSVAFFVEKNGNNPEEISSEVDRYCSWPGQACGYKVGQTEILRLRAKAVQALGGKYSLKAFDQAVVDGGNVPLDVLAKEIDRYIAKAGAR